MNNKNTVFKEAKWIWASNSLNVDDYAEFKFSFKKSENVILRLSCDSFYTVYLNGNLMKFMGCSDYPHHKFYDEISLNSLEKAIGVNPDLPLIIICPSIRASHFLLIACSNGVKSFVG